MNTNDTKIEEHYSKNQKTSETAIHILFIGDIVGRPGRAILHSELKRIKAALAIDWVIANGENAAAGSGIAQKQAEMILESGVDSITLGDHAWDQKELLEQISHIPYLCRPANFPAESPGADHLIFEHAGRKFAVFTLLGRSFMKQAIVDCPFKTADQMVQRLSKFCDGIIVEMHAEATAEKQALGRFLDGRVALVVGTHTHVATADASIFPKGTAYLTDAGMTGPHDSVLGRETEPVIQRFTTGIRTSFGVASGDVRLCGCFLSWDYQAKQVIHFERVTVCMESDTTTLREKIFEITED